MDGRGGVRGWASGEKAVAAYERVLAAAMRHNTTLHICLYAMACVMLVVCAILIVFAPAGRETAVTIVALALFLVAAAAPASPRSSSKCRDWTCGRQMALKRTSPTTSRRAVPGDPLSDTSAKALRSNPT